MTRDMWIDFHRVDERGFTLGARRNARAGLKILEGDYIVVGEEDAGDAVARVVKYEPKSGLVRLKVLRGPASSHPKLLKRIELARSRGL